VNNMLGEEDLNQAGFHRWPCGARLASMMAPTLAEAADGSLVALGSGGSNRIRSAVLQVLLGLIDHGAAADDAVRFPRLHYEAGVLNLEGGLGAEAVAGDPVRQLVRWPLHNLFFGGVHTVLRRPDGRLEVAADPRRGGAAALAR